MVGPFFDCVCQYCGDHFKGYASDLSAAYDTYVQDLPATGYISFGKLIWQSTFSDFDPSLSFSFFGTRTFSEIPFDTNTVQGSIMSSGNGFCVIFFSSASAWSVDFSKCKIKVPRRLLSAVKSLWSVCSVTGDAYYDEGSSSSFKYIELDGMTV